MSDEQAIARVTVWEEIQCLLAAGWTWDGDKLVHPGHKTICVMYKRTDSQGFGARIEQFEAELQDAVRKARQRDQNVESGGH
jgi:hypothetical protein